MESSTNCKDVHENTEMNNKSEFNDKNTIDHVDTLYENIEILYKGRPDDMNLKNVIKERIRTIHEEAKVKVREEYISRLDTALKELCHSDAYSKMLLPEMLDFCDELSCNCANSCENHDNLDYVNGIPVDYKNLKDYDCYFYPLTYKYEDKPLLDELYSNSLKFTKMEQPSVYDIAETVSCAIIFGYIDGFEIILTLDFDSENEETILLGEHKISLDEIKYHLYPNIINEQKDRPRNVHVIFSLTNYEEMVVIKA